MTQQSRIATAATGAAASSSLICLFVVGCIVALTTASPVSLPTSQVSKTNLIEELVQDATLYVSENDVKQKANNNQIKTVANNQKRSDSEKLRRELGNFISQWKATQFVLNADSSQEHAFQTMPIQQQEPASPTSTPNPKQMGAEPAMIVAQSNGDAPVVKTSPVRLIGGPLRWG